MQEYVPGGDFRTLLNNTGVLHFNHARFYISEMFTSVNALHELGYIHRDLKPENFLIDSTGHIKLTDFGLSAGKLAPERMESMKMKLEKVKDMDIPERSTTERRNAYRTLRETDENYVGNPVLREAGLLTVYRPSQLWDLRIIWPPRSSAESLMISASITGLWGVCFTRRLLDTHPSLAHPSRRRGTISSTGVKFFTNPNMRIQITTYPRGPGISS